MAFEAVEPDRENRGTLAKHPSSDPEDQSFALIAKLANELGASADDLPTIIEVLEQDGFIRLSPHIKAARQAAKMGGLLTVGPQAKPNPILGGEKGVLGETAALEAVEGGVGFPIDVSQRIAEIDSALPGFSQVPLVAFPLAVASAMIHPPEDVPDFRKKLRSLYESTREDFKARDPSVLDRAKVLIGSVAQDPLNLVGAPKAATAIQRLGKGVVSAAGRKMIGKGFLSEADLAGAFVDGITDDVVRESENLAFNIELALNRQKAHKAAVAEVRGYVQKAGKKGRQAAIEILEEISEETSSAANIAKEAGAQRVARLTAQYRQERARIHEALRKSSGRASAMLDDAVTQRNKIKEDYHNLFLERRDESIRRLGVRGTVLSGLSRMTRAEADRALQLLDESVDSSVRSLVDNAWTEHREALEALERGYRVSLHETEIATEAAVNLAERSAKNRISMLDPMAWENHYQKRIGSLVPGQFRELEEKAFRQLMDASARIVRKPIERFTANDANTLTQWAEDVVKLSPEDPAELVGRGPLGNFFEWVRKYALDPLIPGRAASFNEGLLRPVARRLRNSQDRNYILKELPKVVEGEEGRAAKALFLMEQQRRHVSAEIRRVARSRLGRQATSDEVASEVAQVGKELQDARRAGDISRISDPTLRSVVADAGAFLDDLSIDWLNRGMLNSEQARKKFIDNMGRYMHTFYAAHDMKNWAKAVENTGAWEEAFRYLRGMFPEDELSNDEIVGYMARMVLDKEEGWAGFLSSSGLKSPRLDVLRHKKDIPVEIQGLLGVNQDFVAGFETSAIKMIMDMQAVSLQRRILRSQIENGMIRLAPTQPSGLGVGEGYTTEVSTLFRKIAPGVPLYTFKENAQALGILDRAAQSQRRSVLGAINGMVKAGKIIPSTGTQSRNLWSLPFMWAQAGVLNSAIVAAASGKAGRTAVGEAIETTLAVLKAGAGKGRVSQEIAEKLARKQELGLMGTGSFTGEIDIWENQARKFYTGASMGLDQNIKQAGRTFAGRPYEFLKSTYRDVDDMSKVFASEILEHRLKALVKTDADRLALIERFGTDNLEVVAAEMAKDTVQHFPRTSPVGKKAARFPLAGTFVSFPMEMARNQVNTLRLGAWEVRHGMKTGNPLWVLAGMERYVGVVQSTLGFSALGAMKAAKYGITARGMSAIRDNLMYSWDQNSDFIITDVDTNNWTLTAVSAGYANPNSSVQRIITGVSREGSWPEKMERMAGEIEEVFLGREIFATAAVELLSNRRATGRFLTDMANQKGYEVYNADDPEKLRAIWEHAFKELAPGIAVNTSTLLESLGYDPALGMGRKRKGSFERVPTKEVLRFFGAPSVRKIDIGKMLRQRVRYEMSRRQGLKRAYRSRIEAASSPGEMLSVQEMYRKEWGEMDADMKKLFDDFMSIPGTTPGRMRSALEGIMPKKDAQLYMRGQGLRFEEVFK